MQEEINKLKQQISEIKDFIAKNKEQQITYPLDLQSFNTINELTPIYTGQKYPIFITDLLAFGLEVSIDGEKRTLYASSQLKAFTATPATDVITYNNQAHGLSNGDLIAFVSTNTLPAPLDEVTQYYVVSATSTTFKVSLTSGGVAVDITDTGTGTHYFGKIPSF